jgi:type I restriction enzyme M protein
VPVGVLDKFQVAGVFVNWWDNIKYDLKTIMQNGWDAGLIPDEYLIEKYFKDKKNAIEKIEMKQSEHETNLEEAVEDALNQLEYELDEEKEEKATPTLAKKELKKEIDRLINEKKKPEEAKPYQEADTKIKELEGKIKECKKLFKDKQAELELKLILKRYGSEDEKAESEKLLKATKAELIKLEADIETLIAGFKADLKDTSDYNKIKTSTTALEKALKKSKDAPDKLNLILEAKKQFKEITKAYNARVKDQGILQTKLDSLDKLLEEIGGIISTEEAQRLILKKHFDIINSQLQRYLNAEKRALVAAYENLFGKYFTSSQQIEEKRNATMSELNDFLTQLNYLS